MNNSFVLSNHNSKNTLKISFILLCVFIVLTILIFNIYKGNKLILPNLNDELREKSDFHLLKSMGWGFLFTIFLALFLFRENTKQGKYGVNKIVKI